MRYQENIYGTHYRNPRGEETGAKSLFKVKMAENFSDLEWDIQVMKFISSQTSSTHKRLNWDTS